MKIAIVDLETTSTHPSVGTIVEVGICLLDLETGFTSKLLDLIVKHPQFETLHESENLRDSWVFNNTNLSVEMVRKGQDWAKAGYQVQRIINKFPITAYNRSFDFTFLQASGIKLKQILPCIMIAATNYFKIPDPFDGYKPPSFEIAWQKFFPEQSDYKEIHRAYDDAEHEATLLYKLYSIGAWKPVIKKLN